MKNFKLYTIAIMIITMMVVAGCENEDANPSPQPDLNQFIGAYTTVVPPSDPADLFFNAINDLNDEQISFSLDYDDFDVTDVQEVTLRLEFTEFEGQFDEFRGEFVDLTYPQIDMMTIPVSSLPSEIIVTAPEIVETLALLDPKFTSVDSLEVGDFFQLTFPLNLDDGTELTVALNSDLCNEPAQPSFGGCGFAWNVGCSSDLNGTANYEIIASDWGATGNTGTIEITETAANGVYTMGSWTYGLYQTVYGCCEQESGSALRMFDTCQRVTFSTADGYGCPWTIQVVDVQGPVLTISYAAGCGPGTHTVELTRADGADWAITM